jgi:diguanylate cyclase (GGDEF)-like protein
MTFRPRTRASVITLAPGSDQSERAAPHVATSNDPELVVWQMWRRLGAVSILGAFAVALQFFGGSPGSTPALVLVDLAYVVAVVSVTAVVRRFATASPRALVVLALADVCVIFATVGCIGMPRFYASALFLSVLALQLTQTFVGVVPGVAIVGTSSLGYLLLLFVATLRGDAVSWVDFGFLGAYLAVAINAIVLHRSANARLTALVDLFGAAQRGDFSQHFIEGWRREPDGITLLGRSYNHLRFELAAMVMTDSLTGSLNRRGFQQVLDRAVEAASRYAGELALLAIDVDYFKQINDSEGHLAGDAILRELGALLNRSARAGDIVARVGGEEFVLLLPGADSETAGVAAERLIDTIRSHRFVTPRGARGVTVSIGIAAEAVTNISMSAALRARADEALYVAKRLGRDRVVMWAPSIRSLATPAEGCVVVT